MTHSAKLKASGLAAALQYLKEWEGPGFTIADALELYTVDEDELYRTEDMHQCEQCGGRFVDRLPRGLCEPCAVAVDEWDSQTRQPGAYGNASGRTL
jgi:hypothetical protein